MIKHSKTPTKIKAARVANFGLTVFSYWSALAREHGAINLGQGFPDFAPPNFVLRAAQEAMEGYQQYAPLAGMPPLLEAIAEQTEKEWGHHIDPEKEITVSVGATEGIYVSIQALIDPGDEVILIEPFYDSYPASITMAGGISRYVPLLPTKDGKWELDFDELKKLINPKTRMIILNNPNNPTGKCFSLDELKNIAEIAIANDLLVLSDEVYDHLLFDGRKHHPIAMLDGMWDRTITLGSAGKTFSVTGWKIGWIIASPLLTDAIQMAHQWIPFAVATPLQIATASALQQAAQNDYYTELWQLYQAKRDFLIEGLQQAGLRPYVPEGSYFIIADCRDWDFSDDESFCHHLTIEKGVVAIPPSAFYSQEHRHLAKHLARFAFCKEDAVLQQAVERLHKK